MRGLLFLFVLLGLGAGPVRGQAPVLRGIVLDAETQQPVPNAQVGVGNNQVGTSTNVDGRFALPVPARYQQSQVEIGVIGYEKYRRPLPALPGPELRVLLRPLPAALGEVSVSGSVLGIVREAVARIPQNYPTRPTRLEGFFRESDNDLGTNRYRYLGEAMLTVFKAPYDRPNDNGDIVLRQTRKVELQSLGKVTPQKWYAGPFIPHRLDFVHNRMEFINEADFRHYDYKLTDLTTYQDRPVYVISFGPKPGNTHANFTGQLFIDQDTYAFLAAEWHRTPAGLRHELITFDATERAYRVDYQPYAGRWHLKSAWYNTRGSTLMGDSLRHLSEYLTTAIDTAAGSLPRYIERAQFRDVFADNTVRYDSAFWQQQATLLPPEQLRAALHDKERQQQAEQLFAQQARATDWSAKSALLAVLSRLRFGYVGGVLSVAAPAADVRLAFAPGGSSFRAEAQRQAPTQEWATYYGTCTQLDLTRHLAAYYLTRKAFGPYRGDGWEVGATYEVNFRPRHRPIYGRVGVAYTRQRVSADFGTFTNDDRRLRVAGKRLDADKVSVALQQLTDAWQAKVGLGLEISHRLELVADVGYLLPQRTRSELHLAEKSGLFFNRHDVDTTLPRSDATVLVNNEPAGAPWHLKRGLLTVGLQYKLR